MILGVTRLVDSGFPKGRRIHGISGATENLHSAQINFFHQLKFDAAYR